MVYDVTVYSYEAQTRDGQKKFRIYNVQSEKQGLVPLKFTVECQPPKMNKFKLKFDGNKALDKKTGKPMMWCKEIIEFNEIVSDSDSLFEL